MARLREHFTPGDCNVLESHRPAFHHSCPAGTRIATAVAVTLFAVAPMGIASAETADEFVARLNKEFADIALELNAAGWTQATYITVDTQ